MSRAQQFEILAAGALYNGAPVVSGYARFYEAGTTTLKNAWDDPDKTVALTTKVLDAQGRAEVYGDGIYKIRLYAGNPDTTGVLRAEIDYYKCTALVGNRTTVTGNLTATKDYEVILGNTAAGDITLTLDDVATFDRPVVIKKINAANSLIIATTDSQLIDTFSSLTLTADGSSVELVPDVDGDLWRQSNELAGLVGLIATADEINDACVGALGRNQYNGGTDGVPALVVEDGSFSGALDYSAFSEDVWTLVGPTGTLERQTLRFLETASDMGGTFILSDGVFNTSAIAYNASAATIQTALDVLYGAGKSTVASLTAESGTYYVWTITFEASVGPSGLTLNAASITGTAPDTSLTESSVAWAALDDIPTDVEWIEVAFDVWAYGLSDTPGTMNLATYAKNLDITYSATEKYGCIVSRVFYMVDTNGDGAGGNIGIRKIPTTNRSFEVMTDGFSLPNTVNASMLPVAYGWAN